MARIRNRRAARTSNSGASWISYSDMMAALLLVFVLILSVSLYQYFTMLETKTAELDAERASVNRRIRDVSEAARRDCAGLSAGWVRLYNEALGLADSGDSAGNQGSAPGGAHDAPGSAGTAHAGVRQDALATPEDVLAHIRDFGGYCRKLEAGYRALVDFMEGTP